MSQQPVRGPLGVAYSVLGTVSRSERGSWWVEPLGQKLLDIVETLSPAQCCNWVGDTPPFVSGCACGLGTSSRRSISWLSVWSNILGPEPATAQSSPAKLIAPNTALSTDIGSGSQTRRTVSPHSRHTVRFARKLASVRPGHTFGPFPLAFVAHLAPLKRQNEFVYAEPPPPDLRRAHLSRSLHPLRRYLERPTIQPRLARCDLSLLGLPPQRARYRSVTLAPDQFIRRFAPCPAQGVRPHPTPGAARHHRLQDHIARQNLSPCRDTGGRSAAAACFHTSS